MERRGRAVARDRVRGTDLGGHRLLEGRNDRPLCQEVRSQDRNHGLDIGIVDRLASVGDHWGLC
jgi:hypothetical protein